MQSSLSESEQFQAGDLHIDFNKHKVLVRGEDVHLTQNEYRIVALLARYSGRVITYDAIMQEIWGPNMKSDNKILRVNMANARLRRIPPNRSLFSPRQASDTACWKPINPPDSFSFSHDPGDQKKGHPPP